MLGIEDYGSDNDSDNDDTPMLSSSAKVPPSKSSMPTTTPKSKRAPKKIAIALPSLSNNKDEEDDDLKDERPVSKKPRLQSSAGVSSLLSMLPAPKRNNPLPSESSSYRERVLGGGMGGLVFSAHARSINGGATHEDRYNETEDQTSTSAVAQHSTIPHPFLPPSLTKGKPNISVEEGASASRTRPKDLTPAIDFFPLGLFL